MKKTLGQTAAEQDFEGLESDDSALIDVGKSMGLKMESEDIHKLLKSHKI